MTEPTMRERVARAIAHAAGDDYYEDIRHWDKIAIAAIKTMREPTAEMGAAFYAACDERGNVLWKHGYRAMIDATLAETTPQ